jgi:hypothetical protein
MKKTSRLWWLAALAVVVSVPLALLACVGWRLSQNGAGLCLAANKVLGQEELARLVARNLLLNEISNSRLHEAAFRNGRLRVGVIHGPDKPDVRAIVAESFGNERSFEENFSIQPVLPAEAAFDARSVESPFTVVTYDASRGGRATFVSTVDIRRAPGFMPSGGGEQAGILERYRGFGNHYYRVVRSFIARDCCDNRSFGAPREDYLRRKKEAYQSSMQSFERGLALREDIVSVSNCGDIPTVGSDIGAGLRTIKWISK